MSRARQDKRIGLPVPFDPYRPVNTFWDFGMDDETAIWFHQTDGQRHRLIDFYGNSGGDQPPLPHAYRRSDAQEPGGLVPGQISSCLSIRVDGFLIGRRFDRLFS